MGGSPARPPLSGPHLYGFGYLAAHLFGVLLALLPDSGFPRTIGEVGLLVGPATALLVGAIAAMTLRPPRAARGLVVVASSLGGAALGLLVAFIGLPFSPLFAPAACFGYAAIGGIALRLLSPLMTRLGLPWPTRGASRYAVLAAAGIGPVAFLAWFYQFSDSLPLKVMLLTPSVAVAALAAHWTARLLSLTGPSRPNA